MTWAIIAWLYLAGVSAAALIVVDTGASLDTRPRKFRAGLFIIAWPVFVPAMIVIGAISL